MPKFNAQAYLTMIAVPRQKTADLAYLQTLQKQHLHHIPFENLDIHCGIPIQLEVDHLFDKIVARKRGGFCYELNGLFYALLQELGYDCWRVMARVYEAPRKYSPPYDHMALVVRLGRYMYLADVGFAEFSLHPIRLEKGRITKDGRNQYRVDQYYDYCRINTQKAGKWIPEYIFKLTPQAWNAFHDRSIFHQSDSGSHFQKGPMITKLSDQGRMTLTDKKFKYAGETKPIKGEEEFAKLLQQHFDLSWNKLKKPSKD
ncbi:MAG: arylamine N-acetyltransferase [Bacteroidota bacterium]